MATAMRLRGVDLLKEKETTRTRQMGVGRVNLSLTMRMQIELGRGKETWTAGEERLTMKMTHLGRVKVKEFALVKEKDISYSQEGQRQT
jgi:hypothetical protein